MVRLLLCWTLQNAFIYDAISRLEKAAEQGSAIAAAVEGVERQLGESQRKVSPFGFEDVTFRFRRCDLPVSKM
jgi:hypothetical protein